MCLSTKTALVVNEIFVFKVDIFLIISSKSFLTRGSPPVSLILSTPYLTNILDISKNQF